MPTPLITYTPGALDPMTVQTYDQPGRAIVPASPVTAPSSDLAATLGRWLEAAVIAQQIAEVACRGPFVPRAFQGKPEHAATAILAGAELGLSPGMALRSFHVIEGTASLSAKTMRALIRAAGHEFEVIENTPQRCIVRGRRRGDERWEQVEWTIEMARTAGLDQKDVWRKYPQRMLLARSTTDLGDISFGDVLAGMQCAEVLSDMDPDEYRVEATVAPSAPRVSAAAVLATPAPAAVPASSAVVAPQPAPLDAATEAVDAARAAVRDAASALAAEDPAPMTERQVRHINDLFVQLGVTGTGQLAKRRQVLTHMLARTIDGSSTMTEAEAQSVIDTLRGNGREVLAEVWPPTAETEVERVLDGAADARDAAAEQAAAEATYQSQDDAAAEAEQQAAAIDPTADDAWGDPR